MLAWHTKATFRDLDTLTEIAYRADRMLTCIEIYRQHGKDFFQELELNAARQLALELSSGKLIASLGGGTIDNELAMKTLSGLGVFIYLQERAEVLYERIAKGGIPAFLDADNPYEDFLNLYKRRTPLYERAADILVPLAGGKTEDSFNHLLQALEEKQNAR